MKGMHFAKPLEYRVEVPAEEFTQGQAVEGTVSVTNRDAAARDDVRIELGLGFAAYKAMKAEGAAAFDVLERQVAAEGVRLEPGETHSTAFSFKLAHDCPVRSKEASPFLLYGEALEEDGRRGQIDLSVRLAPPLEAFIAAMENHFAFEARGYKRADGYTEVRMKPPDKMPTLQEVLVWLRLDGDEAEVQLRVRRKTLKRGEGGGVETRSSEATRTVPRGEFVTDTGMPNRPLYRELIRGMLDELVPTITT